MADTGSGSDQELLKQIREAAELVKHPDARVQQAARAVLKEAALEFAEKLKATRLPSPSRGRASDQVLTARAAKAMVKEILPQVIERAMAAQIRKTQAVQGPSRVAVRKAAESLLDQRLAPLEGRISQLEKQTRPSASLAGLFNASPAARGLGRDTLALARDLADSADPRVAAAARAVLTGAEDGR